jgi:CubicO group peptidase (beta-lactamase class C family)
LPKATERGAKGRLAAVRVPLFLLIAVFSSSPLSAADTGAAQWVRGAAADNGLDPAPLAALGADVRSGKFVKIGSVLIARHGKLVYEEYFDGNADTQRDTRSATKSITDILVGIAIDEGKLRGVEARVLPLFPERQRSIRNPDPRKARITIEDLLTMSSPLECDDWNDASRGNEERMYLVEDWTQFVLDLPIRGRMYTGDTPPAPPYGRNFSYCTGGAFVLGEVLSRVTGMRADRYAEAKLFAPLGIHAVTWVYSPLGRPQTGGGLRLTSPDLLRIAQLYLNDGRWGGQQIVSAAWVKASTTPHARIDEATEYGYLWWLKSFGAAGRQVPAYFMSGNGGNKVVVIPELDMAAVITSTNYGTRGMHEQTERILNEYLVPAVSR